MRAFHEQLLIHVDARSATAALWRAGRFRSVDTFENEPSGRAAFKAFALRHARRPIRLTAETFEEDYAIQELPPVSRRDGAAMLQRRLAQLYRDCTFRGAILLPDSRGRRSCLFAALTGERILGPWMDILRETECSIAGIHPLSAILIDLLDASNAAQLLVVRQRDALRFVYLHRGGLRLHRLTPVRVSPDDPDTLLAEISRTRVYLESAGLLLPSAMLECRVLDPVGTVAGLEEARLHLVQIDLSRLAATLHCPRADTTCVALALLGRRSPALNLAPASATQRFRVRRSCRRLHLTAAAVAAAALASAGIGIRATQTVGIEARDFAAQLAAQERHLEATFPNAGALRDAAARAESLVEMATRLERQALFPHSAYRTASHAMDRHPDFLLEKLEWRSDPADAPQGETSLPRQVVVLELAWSSARYATGDVEAVQSLLGDIKRQRGVSRVVLKRSSPNGMSDPATAGTRPPRYEIQFDVQEPT